jgi:hypothetical protein
MQAPDPDEAKAKHPEQWQRVIEAGRRAARVFIEPLGIDAATALRMVNVGAEAFAGRVELNPVILAPLGTDPGPEHEEMQKTGKILAWHMTLATAIYAAHYVICYAEKGRQPLELCTSKLIEWGPNEVKDYFAHAVPTIGSPPKLLDVRNFGPLMGAAIVCGVAIKRRLPGPFSVPHDIDPRTDESRRSGAAILLAYAAVSYASDWFGRYVNGEAFGDEARKASMAPPYWTTPELPAFESIEEPEL